ncbi:hypothetical protein [Alkaliphilus hydrothermalis]|uniref:Uncharacterized protein n=1 Tax=Alkaliphilus hydrothermalis TaxID=1482730 RepID=A0ABS2NPT7_9FIRM|nr:hypothetical protein [Alkaliphilus hydrothermalis]MBM7614953.1 hypothetical protein [Alkaliphilus hydrothermalis]
MNNKKKNRFILIATALIILLLTINRYRPRYLTDYMKEEDFNSLYIIKYEMNNNRSQQIEIHDQKQIQDIYNYIAEQKVRRKVKWSSLLRVEDGITYSVHFVGSPNKPNCFINLIGDDYIILQDPYDDKSTTFVYVDSKIDLEYFKELITD